MAFKREQHVEENMSTLCIYFDIFQMYLDKVPSSLDQGLHNL